MEKTPSIFERDWNGKSDRVTRTPNPQTQWVFDGEGIATKKIDGTCCLVQDGKLFKRREIKKGKPVPSDFVACDADPVTNKVTGWVPVSDCPEDRWHQEAFSDQPDGTYELVGPAIQGNPENYERHTLVRHADLVLDEQPPRDYDGLLVWLTGKDIEGIVWHHPDGRMAKIKLKDLGLRRGKSL